ncbi:DUF2093 domain-containing protein [uncultured Enterovirga sp.]|uniref:DUF2093 domain-containing protein n=1 Tax=uncultured Enterovirga sp. TaxID=2026352 RepID=UPI0035CAD9AD
MNRHEGGGEAVIEYRDSNIRVIRPGRFVRCAATGEAIPLEELKYWSVERQEAYVSPDAVLQRLGLPRPGQAG